MSQRLYHDHGNDDGLGYPILPRHARAEACAREPLTVGAGRTCGCGQPISVAVATWGHCFACCQRIPEDLRLTMQQTYRPGARQQPAAWTAAWTAARQHLAESGGGSIEIVSSAPPRAVAAGATAAEPAPSAPRP